VQTSQNGTRTPQSPRTVASEQLPGLSSLCQTLVQTFLKPLLAVLAFFCSEISAEPIIAKLEI
jgi:hypothetical protein